FLPGVRRAAGFQFSRRARIVVALPARSQSIRAVPPIVKIPACQREMICAAAIRTESHRKGDFLRSTVRKRGSQAPIVQRSSRRLTPPPGLHHRSLLADPRCPLPVLFQRVAPIAPRDRRNYAAASFPLRPLGGTWQKRRREHGEPLWGGDGAGNFRAPCSS